MFILVNKYGDIKVDTLGNSLTFKTEAEAEREIDGVCLRVGYNLAGWAIRPLVFPKVGSN